MCVNRRPGQGIHTNILTVKKPTLIARIVVIEPPRTAVVVSEISVPLSRIIVWPRSEITSHLRSIAIVITIITIIETLLEVTKLLVVKPLTSANRSVSKTRPATSLKARRWKLEGCMAPCVPPPATTVEDPATPAASPDTARPGVDLGSSGWRKDGSAPRAGSGFFAAMEDKTLAVGTVSGSSEERGA
jgi:hypothetical protein